MAVSKSWLLALQLLQVLGTARRQRVQGIVEDAHRREIGARNAGAAGVIVSTGIRGEYPGDYQNDTNVANLSQQYRAFLGSYRRGIERFFNL